MLHITNGTSVGLAQAGVPGDVLYWVDTLHEGPVPADLSLDQLSRIRERFLADFFELPAIEVSLAERDAALKRYRDHEEVVLWFEHDLYDQLHQLQLLDWFSQQDCGATRVSLISVNRYLGRLRCDELVVLFPTRHPVSAAEFRNARTAWRAFCSPEPTAIAALARDEMPALPYLSAALRRHLEQFPGLRDGLSRTERQALSFADTGIHKFIEMYRADQRLEPSVYMGDSTYQQYLRGLTLGRHALLREEDGCFELTGSGRRVLAQQDDHVRLNGIDRWLGGVHLCEGAPVWRWDDRRGTIAP